MNLGAGMTMGVVVEFGVLYNSTGMSQRGFLGLIGNYLCRRRPLFPIKYTCFKHKQC